MASNEYGEPLDRNGYARSLIQHGDSCHICHRIDKKLDRHECFGGAYRQKSKRLGLWVLLCHDSCHTGRYGVHQDPDAALYMHRLGQEVAMNAYGWNTQEFIKQFGKNYM